MVEKSSRIPPFWWAVLTVGLVLGLGLEAGPALSADGKDPDADRILRSMSSYLGGLPAFAFKADVDNEVIDLSGQKLQFSSFATLVVERPGKFYVRRLGAFADAELFFDGTTLSLYGNNRNVYVQMESPGTIDDAIEAVRASTGLDAPGADLLYADAYSGLAAGVMSSAYLGTDYVNGVECHHLTFRAPKVDWQLWVRVGDAPLPMKYIITSKWVTGAPQYSLRFRDWNTKPQIAANRFAFSAPAGATRLDSLPVNEVGELIIEGEQ